MTATTACHPRQLAKTIGHGIALASSGDTITVAAATYTENLTISFSLNIIGSGASTTIIDGGGVGRVIGITSQTATVTLWGMTLRNGVICGGQGLGVFNLGIMTINRCTITGYHSPGFGGFGGGISNQGT